MSWEGPGFVDHHARLLSTATGRFAPLPPDELAAWHRLLLDRWSTPLDEPAPPFEVHDGSRGALERALDQARARGLVQVTEAGMDDWNVLEALLQLRARRGDLPVRVRLLVASGIAEPKRLQRTGDPWLEVEGVVFCADGEVRSRTCALEQPFADDDDAGRGVLFLDADLLARRIDPFAEEGWTVATAATGDRAIGQVLDAYEKVYGSDCAAAAPRIDGPAVLGAELVRRMADLGVVACIEPGAAVAGARDARTALGTERWEDAYRWDALLDAGVRVVAGPLGNPLADLQSLAVGGDGVVALPVARALDLLTDATAGSVVLSEDPRVVAEDELAELEIEDVRPS